MHYNNFTIQYIEILQRNLHIEIDENENIRFSKNITTDNIKDLIQNLKTIWKNSNTSVKILENKKNSKIQSGLFGLHEDLDLAIRIGFLISDRVVLIDYIFERILNKKNLESINIKQLMEVAIPLVKLLPLAKNGRIVVIPNPFSWNENSKKIIEEVSKKTTLSPSLISMLNMLAICKSCNLHPYTLSNSDEQYERILHSEIDHVDIIGKDLGKYAYEGILGSLISQRILSETSLSCSKNIPIEKYIEVISKDSDFYKEYLTSITNGGSINATENIKGIQKSIDEVLNNRSQNIIKTFKDLEKTSNILGASLSLLAVTITTLPTSIGITGGALVLAGQLGSLLKDETKDTSTIVSVFKELHKICKEKNKFQMYSNPKES